MATKKGSNRNDKLIGTNRDDVLYGLGGNDTLDGRKGDDDLIGGDGNDTFLGRSDGNDAIHGGKGIDTVSYAKATAAISAVLNGEGNGSALKGGAIDALKDIERVVGSQFADTIGFDDAKGAYAFGGKGIDTLYAYGGVVRGDDGTDNLFLLEGFADTIWLQRNKGADTVHFFDSDRDTIWLDGDEFDLGGAVGYTEFVTPGSGHAPVGTKAQLIFDANSTELYYDPDGTGAAPAELIAHFTSSDQLRVINFEIV
jgi:Ca2+-binding RTX toxin-like protein